MSTSTELAQRGRLLVRAPGARITVVDAWLDPVAGAIGFGSLSVDLPAGAYQVRVQTAAVETRRTVAVRSGRVREVVVPTNFASAAPVDRALTFDSEHARLAHDESSGFQHRRPDPRLVVVLRDVPPGDVARQGHAAPFIVLVAGRQASPSGVAARMGATGLACSWQFNVPHTHLCRVRWQHRSGRSIEHALWLSPGWKIVLFVRWAGSGPHLGSMSIHLVPERMRWNPSGIDELAVETALALLRDASVPVAAEPIGTTPMAVLLAQHQRLRRFGRDALQPEAVTMLRSALTDLHPDVRALVDDLAPSTLPPMLSTSLDAALGRTPDASRARSRELLAGIAGQRLAGGPWLRWDATDLYELKAFEGMVEMPEDAAPPSLAVARLAELLRSAATIRRTSMLQVAREMSAAEMAERLGTSPEFVDGALSLALGLQGFATAVQPGGTTVNPRLNGA